MRNDCHYTMRGAEQASAVLHVATNTYTFSFAGAQPAGDRVVVDRVPPAAAWQILRSLYQEWFGQEIPENLQMPRKGQYPTFTKYVEHSQRKKK